MGSFFWTLGMVLLMGYEELSIMWAAWLILAQSLTWLMLDQLQADFKCP
jgi:hypothetical protein